MGKTFWMLVTTQENLDITRERGFNMQGVDSKNRKKAVRMGPEDRVLYYVSDKKGFAATATVISDSFEDDERIWKHHRDEETFPHRVELNPDVVLEESSYVDAFQIGPTMEYVKKWPPHLWPHAFYGMLHIIPQRDFNFLEAELRRVKGESGTGETESPEQAAAESADAVEGAVSKDYVYSESEPEKRGKRLPVARKNRKSSYRRRSQKKN